MKAVYITLIFLILSETGICQNICSQKSLSDEETKRRDSDTTWRAYHGGQINYYVTLRKEIIPKYWKLQEDILNILDPVDIRDIVFLNQVYLTQIDSYLDEMRRTNTSLKNLRPSAEITNLLIFETLRAYPDTYAMLRNPSVDNRKVNVLDVIIVDRLFKKYSEKMKPLESCIKQFKREREASFILNKTGTAFQGAKTVENTLKCDVADLLLWALLIFPKRKKIEFTIKKRFIKQTMLL